VAQRFQVAKNFNVGFFSFGPKDN